MHRHPCPKETEMGQIDYVLKNYLSDRRRYADVCNGSLFAGRQILKAEELEPVTPAVVGKLQEKYFERTSDLVMRQRTTGNLFSIWIMENQNTVDYSMPVRVMLKEAMEYDRQLQGLRKKNAKSCERQNSSGQKNMLSQGEFLCGIRKTDRLHPVTTLVVYWGQKKWDGPRCLHEMIDFGDDEPVIKAAQRHTVVDYPIRILDLSEENNYDVFQTEMRTVFELYARRNDKTRFWQYVSGHAECRQMETETVEVIGRLTGTQELLEIVKENTDKNNKEVCDMCKAIADLIEDGRKQGIKEGKEAMIKILIELASDGSITIQKAAEKAGMDIASFEKRMKE